MKELIRCCKLHKKGQSLIEFILFLPLIMVLFVMMITVGASINGSINQQKAARGYFYFITKGSPKNPFVQEMGGLVGKINLIGSHVVGWYDYPDGEVAVAPCYSLKSLVGKQASDECENPGGLSGRGGKSKYIRSFTVYGVCSAYVFNIVNEGIYQDVSSVAWSSGYCVRRSL